MGIIKTSVGAVLLSLALLGGAGSAALAQGEGGGTGKGGEGLGSRQAGRVRAPELSGGRGWLNTDGPLTMAGLRGKVVLLDFWTYGCINCIHVIPDLKRLEAKYPNQLVVIGVHSAKFENERETENIRRVVLRYGVEHPVVNDAGFKIWDAYAVNAWPTQVLVDPAGYVVKVVRGEGHYEELDSAIGSLVEEFRRREQLDERPLKLALERAKTAALPLAFPGKVLADERGDRLFISDSNHNRVVVARLDGTFLYSVGSGEAGLADGAFERARFRQPQGLALDGETLYVADTGNHSIRRVDLKARTVEVVAGTGAQSREYGAGDGPARGVALSSPWDLQLAGRSLYVAMAGPHQLWRLDLESGRISVFAGTGLEARRDGPRDEAAFAQPSGLATDGRTLFVADSESNIVRAVALSESAGVKPKSQVRTLAGGDLFDFGDRDGPGDEARFQHPLGLAYHDGRLLVADTYNHKIRTLDPRTGEVRTLAGNGRPGQRDGSGATFYEPGGISIAAGTLYVADTNNHAVRAVDLRTKRARTLAIRGLAPPPAAAQNTAEADDDAEESGGPAGPNAEQLKPVVQRLAPGEASLTFDVSLPEGHHLNPSAPHRYQLEVEEGTERLQLAAVGTKAAEPGARRLTATDKSLGLPLRVSLVAAGEGTATLRARLTLYYCREDNTGVCRVKTLDWLVPVEVTSAAPTAPRDLTLRAKVE
jgi:sugar lactone lactonase YvrE